MNVTTASLEKKFKGEGLTRFAAIARKGKFGDIHPEYPGGLDLSAVLDPENKVISADDKAEIRALAGIDAPPAKNDKKEGN